MRLEDEFVMVHVDNLLSDAEMWKRNDLAKKQNLTLSQLEHEAGLDSSAQEDVTNQ